MTYNCLIVVIRIEASNYLLVRGVEMNEIEIIKKAKKGNDKAFAELMSLNKEKLYRIAFAFLKNEQNSLDAVGETVYKAYMNIDKLKVPEYFNTWLIRILINCCKNILKLNSKIVYIDEYSKLDETNNFISETEFKIADNIDLYKAVDKLSEKFKSIIILKYLDDMTIAEISRVLDFPEGTVKVYLRRALKLLKIELREECL